LSQTGRAYRFFVPRLPDQAGGTVDLPPDEVYHARTVLRLKAGREVELFDGRGRVACGKATAVDKRAVTVTIDSVHRVERTGPVVNLAFAVPKGKRLDWLLEKATELGAASLRPVVFERSVAGGDELTDAKRQRWATHCLAAAKQSGLNFLPEICDTEVLSDALSRDVPAGGVRLLGDLGDDAVTLVEAVGSATVIDLLIGPEGGLSDDERARAIGAGFVPVRLGATTLRIETAAVALLAGVAAVATSGPARR